MSPLLCTFLLPLLGIMYVVLPGNAQAAYNKKLGSWVPREPFPGLALGNAASSGDGRGNAGGESRRWHDRVEVCFGCACVCPRWFCSTVVSRSASIVA